MIFSHCSRTRGALLLVVHVCWVAARQASDEAVIPNAKGRVG